MPLSIAACKTVFPLSTVTCRPSIVSVTVSIDVDHIAGAGEEGCAAGAGGWPIPVRANELLRGLEKHPAPSPQPLVLHDLRHRAVVLADVDAAQDAFERGAV